MTGTHLVHGLAPFDAQRNVRVVVETPRGSQVKIKYDEDLACFSLSRVLPTGIVYPYDFGFVPQTLAADGDPLDAMVLIEAATYPGVLVSCRLLGALQIEERGLRGRPNHRLIAIHAKPGRREEFRSFADLGRRMQQELERFFVVSTAFTNKDPFIRGWVGPEQAIEMVERAMTRYREKHAGGGVSAATQAPAGRDRSERPPVAPAGPRPPSSGSHGRTEKNPPAAPSSDSRPATPTEPLPSPSRA
jgi:inorganic pyrophosphatase